MTITEGQIRKVIEINASPEVVFKALTDPNELTQWFPDAAVFEPKVGGETKFTFYADSSRGCAGEGDSVSEGKVLEFVQDRKIAYTWRPKNAQDFPDTVVTWQLESIGKNKTRVTLSHTGFTGREAGKHSFESHNQGWSYFIGELAKYSENKMA